MDIFNQDFREFIECFNRNEVEYILVGGYAVILRGYSRSTGDMDVWVNKTKNNFKKIQAALLQFGLPLVAVPYDQFFSENFDVFSFGNPPYAIEILTAMKGVSFEEALKHSTIEKIEEFEIRVIHLNHLIKAKKAAGRYKDLNDLENLPPEK